MSTVDVQIVRPKKSGTQVIALYIALLLGYLWSGAMVSWIAAHIGVVPDLGYWEAVLLVIGVRFILNKPGGYIWWTKEPKA